MDESAVSSPSVLEGLLSIEAALDAESRPIQHVLVRDDVRDYTVIRLIKRMAAAGIPADRVPGTEIDALANGSTHGGVIALVGERRYQALDSLVDSPAPFVVMLDGVEDPFNFGQCIRAFYAAGAAGLVVRPRTWTHAAGVVARASAGASERMPTAQVDSVEAAADAMRGHDMKIVVADQHRAIPIYDAALSGGVFLVIGGERRGVTRSFADSADLRVMIPYGRAFDQALGTTAASAVLAFEVMRQRRGM